MPKINNFLNKVFALTATSGGFNGVGKFGGESASDRTITLDPEVIQSLQAWDEGWESAVIGGLKRAVPLEERNGWDYVVTLGLAYLKQQGGAVEWHNTQTYYLGSIVTKVATSPLLGGDAPRVSLTYRSRTDDNVGNALPSDFLSDSNWDWVGVIQPQAENFIDTSGGVGDIKNTSLDIASLPINWKPCDGGMYALPDGGSTQTPNMNDRIVISSLTNQLETGGDWNYTYIGTTDGHAITYAELAPHTHVYTLWNAAVPNLPNDEPVASNDREGLGSTTYNTTVAGEGAPHTHDLTISADSNRPPYIKLLPIVRIF